jgi:hypothetical protein
MAAEVFCMGGEDYSSVGGINCYCIADDYGAFSIMRRLKPGMARRQEQQQQQRQKQVLRSAKDDN